MKIVSGGVLVTNERVVEFFKNNMSPSIASAFDSHALAFVTILEEALQRQSSENLKDRELEGLQRLLSSFEDNQKVFMNSVVDTLSQRVRSATDGVVDKVDERVSNMAKQVDLHVTSAVARLDFQSLTSSISDAVKSWLEATTKEAGMDLKLSLSNFQAHVTDSLRHSVTMPLDNIKSQVFEQLPNVIDNRMRDGLVLLEKDITEVKTTLNNGHFDTLLHQALERLSQNRGDVQALHSSLPHMLKETIMGALRKVEDEITDVRNVVDNKMLERLSLVQSEASEAAIAARRSRTDTEQLIQKVDSLEKQLIVKHTKAANTSSKERGVIGESIVFDQLGEKLMERDGYTIESTTGIAHACDFLVRRHGYPDVRIDSKAYDSKEKVRTKEVKKFKSDLLHNGCHGIMVSLYSGIVGKGTTIDIEQLSNNKLAIYLSNTGPNIDAVLDALAIIYKLNPLVTSDTTDQEDNLRLSAENLQKIKSILVEFGEKSITLRTKLKDSLALINDLHDNLLEQLLKSLPSYTPSTDTVTLTGGTPLFICDCGYNAKNGPGLASHRRSCKKSPAGDDINVSSTCV